MRTIVLLGLLFPIQAFLLSKNVGLARLNKNVENMHKRILKEQENDREKDDDAITKEQIALWEDTPVDQLLDTLENVNINVIPEELKRIIQKKMEKGAEEVSQMEVTFSVMGINAFTIAGFALAILMLGSVAILGEGWGSRLFSDETQVTVSRPVQDGNKKRIAEFEEQMKSTYIDYDDIEIRLKEMREDKLQSY